MGIGYGLQCNKCNYHKDILLGIGMLYMPEGLFAKQNGGNSLFEDLVKSPKIRNHTYYLMNEKQGHFADNYGRELYYCERCNSIHNNFYYKIIHQDGEYEPEYKCSKCKHSLQILKIDDSADTPILDQKGNPITLHCPKCTEGILGITHTILWD
jgi:hypothetical protein